MNFMQILADIWKSFTNVGFMGLIYVLAVIVADTTSLENRAFAFAFANSPFIFSAFAGPSLAQAFYIRAGFRWVFGCFAVIMPAVTLPIISIMFYYQRKAKKLGLLTKRKTQRTLWQSVKFFAIEFDGICSPIPLENPLTNLDTSPRCDLALLWAYPFPPTIFSHWSRILQMDFSRNPRHDHSRRWFSGRLWFVGTIWGNDTIHSWQPAFQALCYWIMFDRRWILRRILCLG